MSQEDFETFTGADPDYPCSFYFIELAGKTADHGGSYLEADENLKHLEHLLHLLEPRRVLIKKHLFREIEPERKDFIIDFDKPKRLLDWESSNGYSELPISGLTNEWLDRFVQFFNKYWRLVSKPPNELEIALQRFSRSYEGHTPGERLVDLMIAMEAMFGENNESTYKIALRSSCFMYPPGEDRERAFYEIKKLYDGRGGILHGRHLDVEKTDYQTVYSFEDFVRRSIIRRLDYNLTGKRLKGNDFDDFVLKPWQDQAI